MNKIEQVISEIAPKKLSKLSGQGVLLRTTQTESSIQKQSYRKCYREQGTKVIIYTTVVGRV